MSGNTNFPAEQIGQQINQMKSSQRLLMMDKEKEEFHRVAVSFGGLADLMNKFAERVAAAGGHSLHAVHGCLSQGPQCHG